MSNRILSSALAVVGALFLASPAHAAGLVDWASWCGNEGAGATTAEPHYSHPECKTGPANVTGPIEFVRYNTPCGRTGLSVDVVYPALPWSWGQYAQPIVFQHGGGVQTSFVDSHGHPTNPYRDIAERLASKGAVVIMPIFNLYYNTTSPYDASQTLMDIVNCVGEATYQVAGPGGCGESGEPPCMYDLIDHVAWGAVGNDNLVVMGHSSGGVAGMYMPQNYMSALKSVIMIDPSRAEWVLMPPMSFSRTPIVHIYPDYYGPTQNLANDLFSIGTNNNALGPWVPLGIKELPADECDPDLGCHTAHHCNSMDDSYSWMTDYDTAEHIQTVPSASGATYTGRENFCRINFANTVATGASWTWGRSSFITARYAIAHAACTGAAFGAYYQQWVNGYGRQQDDSWLAYSYNGVCRWRYAEFDATVLCHQITNRDECLAASAPYSGESACFWIQSEDDSVLRINNGQVVNDYAHHEHRQYTANEAYNAATGAFTERAERNALWQRSSWYNLGHAIKCQSGHSIPD